MKGKLTPRSYYLHVPGGRISWLIVAAIVSAILTGVGGYVFFETWHPASLILLLFGVGIWGVVLLLPCRIDVRSDHTIEVVSVLRRTLIVPAQIESIEAGRGAALRVRHRDGREVFVGTFTDSHTLLTELQSVNPKIEFRGC